ncbi:hypothetical protein C4553_01040 [Candidatus Parcubacteria bacterium]|nr:MAG: hypothetical protein C4553_01040 [Candidatus Parcubacteria bacterium]
MIRLEKPKKEVCMEYVFSDRDYRTYKRQSQEKITIEAESLSSEHVKVSLKEAGKNLVELTLSKKESACIINALSAANSECKCVITM